MGKIFSITEEQACNKQYAQGSGFAIALIAETDFNNGCKKAFLELHDKNEIWVTGKEKNKIWMEGPKFQLSLAENLKKELLSSQKSPKAQLILKFLWYQAAKRHPFFKGLI